MAEKKPDVEETPEEESPTTPAREIHPDVLELAQKLTDRVNDLLDGVDTLDANNWLQAAQDIDAVNAQLQNLLVETPAKKSTKK